jgi:probable HAF family extracellular repeat protein
MRIITIRIGTGIAAIGLLSPTCPSQTEYTVTDIGTLGGPASHALALNNTGTVVGVSSANDEPDVSRAFRWIDGEIIDLGTLGGPSAAAFDVNDAGQITGWAEIEGSIPFNKTIRAFLWENGVMVDLGTTGGESSRGWAISANGMVVGASQICWVDPKNPDDPCFPVGNEYAFVWDGNEATDLGGLLGSSDSSALGVNSAGDIVGQSIVVSGFSTPRHAVRWVNGAIIDLGTLGGFNSWAFDVNDSGLIAGFSDNAANTSHHPFIYDIETGEMIDLGLPAGYLSAEALAINSAGHVVGMAFSCCDAAAFLYDGTSMHILNDLVTPGSGWSLIEANDINDAGWIVGRGMHNGLERGFLMKPVSRACLTDLDASGDIGAPDLGELLAQWGTCSGERCPADVAPPPDGDGLVDAADLAELLATWGPCP